ncbi:unnamed protein product, partial [Iphiclides podalirius]
MCLVVRHVQLPYRSDGSAPRLAPRGTTSSLARTARNATNRNSTSTTSQKPPSRNTTPSKPKSAPKSSVPQNELAVDDKIIKICSEIDVIKVKSLENVENDEEHTVAALAMADSVDVCPNDTAECDTEVPPVDGEPVDVQENGSETAKSTNDDENRNQIDGDLTQIPENEKVEVGHSSIVSRPQTPKSGLSNLSRSSPRVQSRPVTPVKPTRPVTTHRHQLIIHSYPKQVTDRRTFTAIFCAKQKEFHRMKKELDLKQKTILETFNILKSLHDRMLKEGKTGEGEVLYQRELVMFNVADWAGEEVAQLCRSSHHSSEGAGELINTFTPIDEEFLSKWEIKVLNIPNSFGDLCIQAFTTRQEVVDWVKVIVENEDAVNDEDLSRITIYNEEGVQLCDILRELKTQADESLREVTQLLKQTCQERSILITVAESLVKELAHLRKDIALHTAATMELSSINAVDTETTKALEDTRRELEEERAAKAALKDKLSTTESQLRQTRLRVNKMDRQLREAEASISSLTGTVKSLEDQSRQKEVQLEARARKLKESLKTGEITNNHIIQERDALQNELTQLKGQLEKTMIENKATVQDLNNQLRDLKTALEAERTKKQEEITMRNMFEESYRESLNTIEELKAQIEELDRKKQNPDLPTEREVELRAEIIATKETLRLTEEEIIACKREKVRFLETLTKIAETDNKMGMHQKLATELLNKEEIMSKMQTQIRELTKSIKLNEQKVIQYEQYVRDMQMYNQASGNCLESSDGATFQELQQEIMHLRMGLLEAVHRNEELTEILMQRDQQLEQQNKTSRAQAKVIKVNKQIAAKAEEIQELFSTLENKQQQIHRLEKIVIALEEQQRRAQAQRTRHEEKIAALEHELAAGGNRRERRGKEEPNMHIIS